MGGMCCVFRRDREAVNEEVFSEFVSDLEYRSIVGRTVCWRKSFIALAQAGLKSSAKHGSFNQLSELDSCVIAFDGRIDNRIELLSELSLDTSIPDSLLLLNLYQKWKQETPQKLIGPFAFALWDTYERKIFCARDQLGLRPFYYFLSDKLFVCSSDLKQVISFPGVSQSLNLGMLGEYLSSQLCSVDETIYSSVKRLPAAHSLVVSGKSNTLQRYWSFGERESDCKPKDFPDKLQKLLKTATTRSLQTELSVGFELSGGLDSASIVSLVRKAKLVDREKIKCFSLVFPGMECDESGYIEHVCDELSIGTTFIKPQIADLTYYLNIVNQFADFSFYPNSYVTDWTKRKAKEQGIDVLLTGFGGDETQSGVYASNLQIVPQSIFSFIHQLVHPLWQRTPISLKQFPKTIVGSWKKIPKWIDEDFAKHISLEERLNTAAVAPRFVNLSQRYIHHYFTSGWAMHSLEMDERASAHCKIEQRHPFRDLDLVEFSYSLPSEALRNYDTTKLLLRRAMADILPPKIIARKDKADISHVFADTLIRKEVSEVFSNLRIERAGWIDGSIVQGMYDKMSNYYRAKDVRYADETWGLWAVLGTELIVRELC